MPELIDDYPDNTSTTGVLAPGSSVTTTIDSRDDHDWFRFHAQANGFYAFTLDAPPGATSIGYVVRDAHGNAVLENPMRLETPAEADYFIDVSGSLPGTYTLHATLIDDDLPLNSQTPGVALAGGPATQGAINYQYDVDWFKVKVESGRFYSVTLGGAAVAAGHVGLGVVNAAGDYQPFAEEARGADSISYSIRLPASGDAFLVVGAWSAMEDQTFPLPYALSVGAPVDDDFGDTVETAGAFQIGETWRGNLQAALDKDYAQIDLVGGVTYAVDFSAAAYGLYGPEVFVQGVGGDAGELYFREQPGRMTFTPKASATYYVSVRGGRGDYSVSFAPAADDYPAGPATSAQLAVGGSASGTLEAGGGDRDWIAIDLPAGGTTNFKIAAASPHSLWDLGATLYDQNGTLVASPILTSSGEWEYWTHDTFAYRSEQGGRYYVEILQNNPASVSYTVTAAVGETDDFGATPDRAGELQLGAEVHGKLELPADSDMLRLAVQADSSYAIEISPAARLSIANTSSPDALATVVNWPGHGIVLHTQRAGELDFLVSDPSGLVTNYRLTATALAPDDIPADRTTSATLTPAQALATTISDPLDADTVRVTLEAGQAYVFEWLGAASGHGTLDTRDQGIHLSLTDSAGQIVSTTSDSSREPHAYYAPAASGDYYLTVASPGGMGGSYTLREFALGGDTAGPALVAQHPAAGATGVGLSDTTLSFTFDEPVDVRTADIALHDSQGGIVMLASGGIAAVENTLTIRTDAIFTPGSYTLSLPHSALHDLAGNAYTGPETIAFSTEQPGQDASGGDDLLAGGGAIDAGAGLDTVSYLDWRFEYDIVRGEAGVTVHARHDNTTDTLTHVERLLFRNAGYALDIDGHGGQAYRLYQAALHRQPDLVGVGFWMYQLDHGLDLDVVAENFIASAEFGALYGTATSDAQFVALLYENVLQRAPDAVGEAFWNHALGSGATRASVLLAFSESLENQDNLASVIGNGFDYTVYH